MATRELEILIKLRDEASATLAGFSKNLKGLEPQFKQMAAVGTVAFGAFSAVAVSSLKEFADSEKLATIANQTLSNAMDALSLGAANRLQDTIGDGGDMFEYLQGKMQDVGKAALQLGFDDDAARIAFAKLYQVSLDVTQAQADMKLAMDLSAFSGRSLEESADAVTKVHAGATRVLKEFGVQLKDGATATEALAILQERTAGSAEQLSHTLEGQAAILKNQFDNLKEAIGGALAPALTDLANKVIPIVSRLKDWADANPELIARIIEAGLAVSALVAGLGLLGLALIGVTAGVAALANPFTVAVLAFTAAAGAAVFFNQQLGQVIATIDEHTGLITAFHDAWFAIADMWTSTLQPALSELIAALQPILPVVAQLSEAIGVVLLIAMSQAVQQLARWIVYMGQLIAVLTDASKWLVSTLTPSIKAVGDTIGFVVDKVETLINALSRLSGVKASALSGIGAGLGSGITGALQSIPLPFMPFAEGGVVMRPTLGLVGEAGPEAIIPLSKFNLPSRNDAPQSNVQRDAGGNTYITNVYAYGDNYGEQDFVDKVGEALMGQIRNDLRFSN